jgi:hypothetical protein
MGTPMPLGRGFNFFCCRRTGLFSFACFALLLLRGLYASVRPSAKLPRFHWAGSLVCLAESSISENTWGIYLLS